jgi:tripartite-type tricarboxylate transporter receptor subunit TctC
MPFAKDDRVRIIAVSTATRMAQLPEVATVAELFPGFKLTSWNGLIGPGKMPDDIVEKVAKATIEAAHDPVVMKTLTDLGIAPIGNTPAQFRETIEKERPLLAEAIKAADLPAP